MYRIETRRRVLVNTDPQRRCYDGVHARSELQWTAWEEIDCLIADGRIAARLEWWRDLNQGAVNDRGEGARREFRAVRVTEEA